MTLTDIMLKYEGLYIPRGKYRKFLLKTEALNTADMFDYLSRLVVRIGALARMPEMECAPRAVLLKESMLDLAKDIRSETDKVLSGMTKDTFCEIYDGFASVSETLEEKVGTYLESIEPFSEDAQLIKKQSRLQKTHPKDATRSRAAKAAWKKNKPRYVQAIKKFNKSSAGKQFHRNLSRFNRLDLRKEAEQFSENDVLLVCKGMSSMITHLIAEVQIVQTEAVDRVTPADNGEVLILKEIFYIFNELHEALFESYFSKDKEVIADVLEVVGEFFDYG